MADTVSAETPAPLRIGGTTVRPGERVTVDLPIGELYTRAPVNMAVHVWRGREPGPCLAVSAAVHGDELNGIEIIRQVLADAALAQLRGTLLAVPVVNVFGVMQQARYLPDRRDLNRSFPGSARGSMAARLAHLLLQEIVPHATHFIDLHTGAVHRSNIPQLRADLNDAGTLQLARAFGVPVLINSAVIAGSLREQLTRKHIPNLLYEAGEALRFDESAIRAGTTGLLNVMRALNMLPADKPAPAAEPYIAQSSQWLRAPSSGILRLTTRLGDRIARDQVIGAVESPFDAASDPIRAVGDGIVIGRSSIPLVRAGEAVIHVAHYGHPDAVETGIHASYDDHGDPDEPEDEHPPH